jgi:hypothetical protein
MQSSDITKVPTLYVVAYAHLDTQFRWEFPQRPCARTVSLPGDGINDASTKRGNSRCVEQAQLSLARSEITPKTHAYEMPCVSHGVIREQS